MKFTLHLIHLWKPSWLFVLLLFTANAAAQTYGDAKTARFTLATNGIGIGYGQYLSTDDRMLTIDLQTISHPKETNVQNLSIVNPRAYVFGKISGAATLRLSYTTYKTLSSGTSGSLSPSISLGFAGGPSLGIMKPYYVSYQHSREDGSGPDIIQQNEETASNQDSIYGPVSWTRGFSELSFTPGLHADIHLAIKWNHSYYLQSCKMGVRLDYFPRSLEILYNTKSQYFTSIYIAYEVGR